jgi:hypothetical protein
MAAPELVAKLTAYVKPGANSVTEADSAFIEDCLDEAIAMVDNRCGTGVASVPMPVLHRAYIELGGELYNRRSAPNGISQFSSADDSAIRVARDPMTSVETILRPFLGGGFA